LTIASPLPYLFAEERHGDRQAREALFCTFNADLGFFERTVLGVTQATGARVTVVGDARMSDPDPRAARNAGTRYIHGLAATPSGAAFHPKVAVVAGPERAMVAIGSGNLSPGGWHLNNETWTVATADQERCPAMVAQLAEWLRGLHHLCMITPQAVQGIQRTAARLEQLAATSTVAGTGHQLVHSSALPLLDQLPGGRADELLIYAPFHDQNAEALRSLIERLTPAQVTLAVQSDQRTVIQPDAVAHVIDGLEVRFKVVEDTSKEYRHGKLIEAVDLDGNRWTLTGSPNLSGHALLRSARDGGNIEVGIVSRPRSSLFPGGQPITLSDVPAVRINDSAVNRPAVGVLLLAAVRAGGGLRVVFAKPPAVSVQILSSLHANFDQWTDVGTVPSGVADYTFADVDLPGGTRVRGAWDAGKGAVRGSVVFVIDPDLVLERPGESTPHQPSAPPDPIQLISDPRLLEMWMSAVGQLAAARTAVALPRATGPAAPRGETAAAQHGAGLRIDTDEERWLSYADDAKARLGSAMFHFALGGFPALRGLAAAAGSGLMEPTDRVIDERKPGLDEDELDAVNDDVDPSATADAEATRGGGGDGAAGTPGDDGASQDAEGILSGQLGMSDLIRTAHEKRRIQRDLEQLARHVAPNLPAIDRLAIINLVLCALQSHVWEDPIGGQGWMRILGETLGSLDLGDIPERICRQVASAAAVAIYVMHEYRPTTGRTAAVLLYEKAASQTAHLYAEADPQLVADYATPFTNKNGYPIDPDAVMHIISMIVQGDPLTEAADLLEDRHPAWQIHKHNDTLLHIDGDFGVPFLAAAEALDAISGADPAAVWVTGRSAAWTVVTRRDDTLIRVDKQKGRIMWRHYRLSNLISPSGIAHDQDLANRVRMPHGPLNQAFPEARRALVSIGFDPAAEPPSSCPPTAPLP
jgi:hypothetical protein